MNDASFHLTPNDVRGHQFTRTMRGYDRLEVDAFRDRVAGAGTESHALVLAGEKRAPPHARDQGLIGLVAAALRDHNDERRQLLVLASDAVA